jgi:hypothetical protein
MDYSIFFRQGLACHPVKTLIAPLLQSGFFIFSAPLLFPTGHRNSRNLQLLSHFYIQKYAFFEQNALKRAVRCIIYRQFHCFAFAIWIE